MGIEQGKQERSGGYVKMNALKARRFESLAEARRGSLHARLPEGHDKYDLISVAIVWPSERRCPRLIL